MKRRISYLVVGSVIFVLFIIFSYVVHKNIFTQLDFNTTVRLQDHISRRFDTPFSVLSYIGNFEYTGIVLLIVLTVYFLIRKKWFRAIWVFFLFGFMHLFELYGKYFVNHLPPPEFMLRNNLQGAFPQFYVRLQFSYPSGHSARAGFVTVFLGMLIIKSKKLNSTQKIIIIAVLGFYDSIMMISRIYLGEHWTTDVIGGFFLGTSLAFIASLAIG